MHHTVLWNAYIHDFLVSGRVIITDAVAVGIRSYGVSPINVLATVSPRPSLATHTVIRPVLTTKFSGTTSLPKTFRIDAGGHGIWYRSAITTKRPINNLTSRTDGIIFATTPNSKCSGCILFQIFRRRPI